MQKKPIAAKKYRPLSLINRGGHNFKLLRGNRWWNAGSQIRLGSTKNLSQLGDCVPRTEMGERQLLIGDLVMFSGRQTLIDSTGYLTIARDSHWLPRGIFRYFRS